MVLQQIRHQHNLALFESYLTDLRIGVGISFLAVILMVFLSFGAISVLRLSIWLLLVLGVELLTLFSFKLFNINFDERQFKEYLTWHYMAVGSMGLVWGLACFFLLPDGMKSINHSLILTVLAVIVAYSASVMSASKVGMLSFTTPLMVCMLVYLAGDMTHYGWWFVAIILLGATSVIFGHLNHENAIKAIDHQLQNVKNIEELTKLKASMQKANMELVVKNETLIAAQNRLEMLATNDELTRVFNRRYAMTYLDKVFAELKRHHSNFVVVLADIDHFKSINDRFGHPAGDEVLRRFSKLIKEQLREVDTVARFGGEEFLIMLPKTKEEEARAIIQRLCNMVAEEQFDFDHQHINVTSSFGLAYYKVGDTVEKLIERADLALYHAKNSGRNNVKTFDDAQIAVQLAKVGA